MINNAVKWMFVLLLADKLSVSSIGCKHRLRKIEKRVGCRYMVSVGSR